MFKPLLKTLPSLSGNMKLDCIVNVDRRNTNDATKTFEGYVDTAYLNAISSKFYDKRISINLKNNDFEYDVKEFYKYYFDMFYDTNFRYSKHNCEIIDFTQQINDSNKDFEFGCTRISYLKNSRPFAFFCPIYVDNPSDILNKELIIKCKFISTYKITKYLRIPLSNCESQNLLADYLMRYVNKIDDRVIYCSNSYKNIYYGIDVMYGGFIHVEDNISSNIYKKYYTINKFDSLINEGFKRNNMMMKQIISLCFLFDPSDLLNEFESIAYSGAKISISAVWHDAVSDMDVSFYNFSDDYSRYNEDIFTLNQNNIFNYTNTNKNIMDISYPAFNEASSENYKYVNTISKNYNRWKMKYSDDTYPYIINLNYAFSNNQNSLYMYKEFPLLYSPMYAQCKINSDSEYNMLFDLFDIYRDSDDILINNKSNYYNLFNKKFIGNFFNLLLRKDNSMEYENIFMNDAYWKAIDADNKIYYKGILYDMNILYKNNLDMPFKIDKFSLFVNPMFNQVDATQYNKIYNTSRIFYDLPDEARYTTSKIYDYDFIEQYSEYMINHAKFYEDMDNGQYVEVTHTTPSNYEYDENSYYDVNDILIMNYLVDKSYNMRQFIDNSQLQIIDGYKVLGIFNAKNIYSEVFMELITKYETDELYNDNGAIYRSHRFIELEPFIWSVDKVYFSIYPNKTKYTLFENYELLKSKKNSNIVVYFKTRFVKSIDFDNIEGADHRFTEHIDKYCYSNGLYDSSKNIIYTDHCFELIDAVKHQYGKHLITNHNDDNVIYIDPYNLRNIYSRYIFKQIPDIPKEYKYCKFLNMEHIAVYFENVHKDQLLKQQYEIRTNALGEDYEYRIPVIDTVFIKTKDFNNVMINLDNENNFNTLSITDHYIPIKEYGINNIAEIVQFIDFNNTLGGYFSFNENYFIPEHIQMVKSANLPMLKNFEICFYKPMYRLNDDLYNLIMAINDNSIFKDLYLYHLQEMRDFKVEMNYFDVDLLDYIGSETEIIKILDKHIKQFKIEDEYLVPYFNEIYEEPMIDTKIYSDYFLNNIIQTDEVVIGNYHTHYYKFIEDPLTSIVPAWYAELNLNQDISNVTRYSKYESKDNEFMTVDRLHEMFPTLDMDNVSIYSNMITYWYNNAYYGFYIINTEFDNTENTLNLYNDNYEKINAVNYINGIPVEDINTYSYTYLGSIYKNIIPYINNSNIVKYALNNIDTIIKPNNYKLVNNYQQYPNIVNNEIYSYTIYVNNRENPIELMRYFDNITPYIPSASNVSSYYLYYKNTNRFIENDLTIQHLSYIMYNETNSLTYYSPVAYYDIDLKLHRYYPVEYKYYNDNTCINTEKLITCKINNELHADGLFTERELIEFENNDAKIFDIFKKNKSIILANEVSDNENAYLFLYKKYSVKFDHIFIKIYNYNEELRALGLQRRKVKDLSQYIDTSITDNSRLYKLEIKFILQ